MSTTTTAALLAADLVGIAAVVAYVLRDVARHRAAPAAAPAEAPDVSEPPVHPTMPAAQTVLPGGWFVPPTDLVPVPRVNSDNQSRRGLGSLYQH